MKKDQRTTAVHAIGTVRTRALREPKSPELNLNLGAFQFMLPIFPRIRSIGSTSWPGKARFLC